MRLDLFTDNAYYTHHSIDGQYEVMQMRHKSELNMPPKLDPNAPTERIQLVAPPDWIARVEEWRRRQPRIPNRSEAIRDLVDIALGHLRDIGEDEADQPKPPKT